MSIGVGDKCLKKIAVLTAFLVLPVLSAHASDNVSIEKLKRLEPKVLSQEKQVSLSNGGSVSAGGSGSVLKKQPSGAVIKSVSLDNNTVIINYSGEIEYNILNSKKLNCPGVYVLDIIDPSRVFSTKVKVIVPSYKGVISKVVTAWHSTPQDKALYHAPFLRVSIHVKNCKSRIVKENGELKIIFYNQDSSNNFNTQLQKERAILKKLEAHNEMEKVSTISTAKHCPIRRVRREHADNANRINQPAYKYYSAEYRVPPPPEYIPRPKHNTQTTQKVLSDAFVSPGVITKVTVSNTDVNRIVSPEPIKDVVYSKEKGLMVHFIGKNAFLKFVIKKNPDGTYTYIQEPSEIYVVTSDAVYTIILSPKNIAGRTIRLSGGTLNKIKANEQMFSQLPYEKKLIKIIKAAYENDIPYSWDVAHPQNPTHIIIKGSLTATLITTVNVVGTGFQLKEYKITSPVSMHVTETDFLNTKLAKNPRAVALTGFEVSKENPVYLFIVSKGGGSEQ